MSLFIDIEEGVVDDFPFSMQEAVEKVCDAALLHEKCPYECEISFLLTDDDHIQELNREHRGIDKATDVLSFPNLDYEIPANFNNVEDESYDSFNPESGELILGDIVVSKDHVYSQSEEYGHSPLRELSFLVAHSMLHLMGYDHIEEDERIRMEQIQEEILQGLGITRED